MTDAIAIVSGGMDSITMLHHMVKKRNLKPAVLTYIYWQKNIREIEYARFHTELLGCEEHLVLDLSVLQPLFETSALVGDSVVMPDAEAVKGDLQPPTYVPNRNMIFLALAVAYAESHGVSDVYYGAQRYDAHGYWDTTPKFLERVNAVYSLSPKTPVQVHAPFVTHSKADILRLGFEMEIDYGQTWSCYVGGEVACGKCPTCGERMAAFAEIGVVDPLPYAAEK